ncbi:unnamed protein product [Moneuplotes crassus]|uniref:Uncharacterized protein n=1 Tax=Euplotes crassus TaxID=5936 RepID=A0AAD1XBX2_EUPCR|nr:unnamed protein product [Moneuplotes crassus]
MDKQSRCDQRQNKILDAKTQIAHKNKLNSQVAVKYMMTRDGDSKGIFYCCSKCKSKASMTKEAITNHYAEVHGSKVPKKDLHCLLAEIENEEEEKSLKSESNNPLSSLGSTRSRRKSSKISKDYKLVAIIQRGRKLSWEYGNKRIVHFNKRVQRLEHYFKKQKGCNNLGRNLGLFVDTINVICVRCGFNHNIICEMISTLEIIKFIINYLWYLVPNFVFLTSKLKTREEKEQIMLLLQESLIKTIDSKNLFIQNKDPSKTLKTYLWHFVLFSY